jgi:hypothetical protein
MASNYKEDNSEINKCYLKKCEHLEWFEYKTLWRTIQRYENIVKMHIKGERA